MNNIGNEEINDDSVTVNQESMIEELFGEKQLRWYQIAARNATAEALKLNPRARILIHQPTGVGKTLTGGTILLSDDVRKAVIGNTDRPLRVLFIAHRHRLMTQAERTYNAESGIKTITEANLKESHMYKKS